MKVPADGFKGSPKYWWKYPESLVVADNQQKHCHLLFNGSVPTVPKESPVPKQATELEEGFPAHPKDLQTAAIRATIDEPEVGSSLSVSMG